MHLTRRDTAIANISKERGLLYTLISDNPTQIKNLHLLDTAINYKVASTLNISFNNSKEISKILSQINIKEGVLAMDNVNHYINIMIADEYALLAKRSNEYSKLSFVTPLFMMVFFLGALIVLWASYLKITDALRKAQELQLKLIIQNKEKERRSAELIIANENLHFESHEKESRAAELVIANIKLQFESKEKENRSAELIIANEKLLHESKEKENRAAELIIANKELAFQIEEKEKRALELINTNKELQLFAQIASHDLQEPLRKIQMFSSRIIEKELPNFSEKGKDYFEVIEDAAERMQTLIQDLIAYAQTNNQDQTFTETELSKIINEVKVELSEEITENDATIEMKELCNAYIIPFQFRQLMTNLISNSLKFAKPNTKCHINITSSIEKGNTKINNKLLPKEKYCHIVYSDNGIGFEAAYNEKIFEIFQRLHGKEIYKGTGIGLAIVKKIVENHKGIITAVGKPNEGATFDIYLPTN